jgi:transglutaminase/protease-like cytokinesis protein 3
MFGLAFPATALASVDSTSSPHETTTAAITTLSSTDSALTSAALSTQASTASALTDADITTQTAGTISKTITNGRGANATISYDPIVVGQPTTFTIKDAGDTSSPSTYKYMLQTVYLTTNDSYDFIMDPSRRTYGEFGENTFDFTFYASGEYELRFFCIDKNNPSISTRPLKLTIMVDDPAHPTIDAIASQVIAECKAQNFTDDYSKALWLHDWVINHITYDYSLLYCSEEGVFVRGTGTCESYHAALARLLKGVGIQVADRTYSVGNGHIWTLAKLDGAWYHIDATWNDSWGEKPFYNFTADDMNHMYFGITDDMATAVHSDHKASSAYPATSLKDNYFIRAGRIKQWSQPLEASLMQNLNNKQVNFTLDAANKSWVAAYKNIINPLVAYDLSNQTWTLADGVTKARVSVSYANDVYTVQATYLESDGNITGANPDSFKAESTSEGESLEENKVTVVSLPAAATLTYNGKQQTGVTATTGLNITGNTGTKAGTYTARVTPLEGYAWDASGNRATKTITWKINPAPLSSSSISATVPSGALPYSGKPLQPAATVKFNGATLKAGTDYTIVYRNNTKAGTATAVLTGKGNFTGTKNVSYQVTLKTPTVTYQTHAQKLGWQKWQKNGGLGGTTGKNLRVEAFRVKLENQPVSGGIQVQAHVQKIGWQKWYSNGATAGTFGKALRVEALRIRLTGEMAKHYDVYYRTYLQKFGWTGWAKNGASCGSAGYAYRMEGVQIKLVAKGGKAPGSTSRTFYQKK